jgi:hypothetical protein
VGPSEEAGLPRCGAAKGALRAGYSSRRPRRRRRRHRR